MAIASLSPFIAHDEIILWNGMQLWYFKMACFASDIPCSAHLITAEWNTYQFASFNILFIASASPESAHCKTYFEQVWQLLRASFLKNSSFLLALLTKCSMIIEFLMLVKMKFFTVLFCCRASVTKKSKKVLNQLFHLPIL